MLEVIIGSLKPLLTSKSAMICKVSTVDAVSVTEAGQTTENVTLPLIQTSSSVNTVLTWNTKVSMLEFESKSNCV